MKLSTPLALALTAVLVVPIGSGCRAVKRKLAEKALEETTGAKEVDLSKGGVKVETAKGEKVELGTDAKLPEGWPTFLPRYPGSTVIAAVSTEKTKTVTMTTSDSADQVIAFYKPRLSSAGHKQQAMGNFGGTQTLSTTKGEGKSSAVVSASPQGDTTMVNIALSEH